MGLTCMLVAAATDRVTLLHWVAERHLGVRRIPLIMYGMTHWLKLTLPGLKHLGFCRWRNGHGTGQSGPVENGAGGIVIPLQGQPAILVRTQVPAVG